MIKTMTFSDFLDEFTEDRKNQFSYAGKRALFEELERIEEDTGERIECDVIALCCDYTEYKNATECIEEAGYTGFTFAEDENETKEERNERLEWEAFKWLSDHTQVIDFGTGIIVQNF